MTEGFLPGNELRVQEGTREFVTNKEEVLQENTRFHRFKSTCVTAKSAKPLKPCGEDFFSLHYFCILSQYWQSFKSTEGHTARKKPQWWVELMWKSNTTEPELTLFSFYSKRLNFSHEILSINTYFPQIMSARCLMMNAPPREFVWRHWRYRQPGVIAVPCGWKRELLSV